MLDVDGTLLDNRSWMLVTLDDWPLLDVLMLDVGCCTLYAHNTLDVGRGTLGFGTLRHFALNI